MKPRIKFYNDGSIHDEGFNSLKFYDVFGVLPLNKKQSKDLMKSFLVEFGETKSRLAYGVRGELWVNI